MTKKLYVAALYANAENNQKAVEAFAKYGFENITRWMTRPSLGKPYTLESVTGPLQENLEDMRNADAYLFMPEKVLNARGCHVEFGYILAQIEKDPGKIVYLISNDDPAFHWFHPNVKMFANLEEAEAFLASNN